MPHDRHARRGTLQGELDAVAADTEKGDQAGQILELDGVPVQKVVAVGALRQAEDPAQQT